MGRKDKIDAVRLEFSQSRIYGREDELALIKRAYERVARSKQSEAVMLGGFPGAGKTSIAESFQDEIKGEHFVTGKFDQIGSSRPYSAIVDAFTSLCASLAMSSLKSSIHDCLQFELLAEDLTVLMNVLPDAESLLQIKIAKQSVETEWGFERLQVAFREFIRVLSQHNITLILFLDDLQWADSSSLELVSSLITDQQTKGLLFIGAYRDTEIEEGDPLARLLREMERSSIQVEEMQIGNLNIDGINNMIADVTRSSLTFTADLAEVVHSKTNGNAFFAIQFLRSLYDLEMLYFSSRSYRWEWNIDKVKGETDIADNVVELVASAIQRLSNNVQEVLTIAACFGSYFRSDIVAAVIELRKTVNVEAASSSLVEEVESALETAFDEGLVTHRKSSVRFKFSHDRIRQAAYSLIPEGREREALHLQIGRLLMHMHSTPATRRDWMMLVFIDQLNRGARLITDTDERVQLARRNLEAAEKVVRQSAFFPALEYLKAGIGLMDELNGWKSHYSLQLSLCVTIAEVSYFTGDIGTSEYFTEKVLSNAKNIQDKKRAYMVRINALGAQEKLSEAVEVGYQILREIGQPFPKKPSSFHVLFMLMKANKLANKLTDEELMEIPDLKDETLLLAKELLSRLISFAWFANKLNETAIFILRLFILSLKFGHSKFSGHAFALYGFIKGMNNNFDEAYRYGRLSYRLSDRFTAKDCEARRLAVSAPFLTHLRQPLSEAMEQGLKGYQYGMETGDIYNSGIATTTYLNAYFLSGLPLEPVVKDCAAFTKQLRRYKQGVSLSVISVFHQGMLNLMGRCEDPVKLKGEALDEDKFLEKSIGDNVVGKLHALWFVKMMVAYYFGDLDVALENAAYLWSRKHEPEGCVFLQPSFLMFRTLIAAEKYRVCQKRKYLAKAKKNARALRLWVNGKVLNCQHKMSLMEAELASLRSKDQNKVKELYADAVTMCARTGFVNDAALANERAGLYLRSIGDEARAQTYLSTAQVLYREWGADGKAERLNEGNLIVTDDKSSRSRGSSYRGRQRFMDMQSKHREFNPFQMGGRRLSVFEDDGRMRTEARRRSTRFALPEGWVDELSKEFAGS